MGDVTNDEDTGDVLCVSPSFCEDSGHSCDPGYFASHWLRARNRDIHGALSPQSSEGPITHAQHQNMAVAARPHPWELTVPRVAGFVKLLLLGPLPRKRGQSVSNKYPLGS